MSKNSLNQTFMIGNFPITRQEIAYNIVTDGLAIVAFEQGWSDKKAGEIFFGLGNIDQRLTNTDCEDYVKGFTHFMGDGDKLFEHVKNYTYMLLTKWGVFTETQSSIN